MDVRLKYILDHFSALYGPIDHDLIGWGNDNALVSIPDTGIAQLDAQHIVTPEEVKRVPFDGTDLPVLFASEEKLVSFEAGKAKIGFDVISASFYFLSGCQEVWSDQKDHYGRYPFRASLQAKMGFNQLPVVNFYFEILRQAIEYATNKPLDLKPWKSADWVLFLSHDIDWCQIGWKEGAYYELKQLRPHLTASAILQKVFGKDSWYTFDRILALNKKYNIRSTFYFLPRNEKINGIPHADYGMKDKQTLEAMEMVRKAGCEIGVHGTAGSHKDLKILQEDMEMVPGELTGIRYHYLNYEPGVTEGILAQSGLKYDTSLGFAEQVGYRRGFAHPFYLFDHQTNQQTQVLEFPLHVMDATFYNHTYMGIQAEEAMSHVLPMIEMTKKFKGMLSVLWHNNYYADIKFKPWYGVIQDILKAADQSDATFLNGEEVLEELQSRN